MIQIRIQHIGVGSGVAGAAFAATIFWLVAVLVPRFLNTRLACFIRHRHWDIASFTCHAYFNGLTTLNYWPVLLHVAIDLCGDFIDLVYWPAMLYWLLQIYSKINSFGAFSKPFISRNKTTNVINKMIMFHKNVNSNARK